MSTSFDSESFWFYAFDCCWLVGFLFAFICIWLFHIWCYFCCPEIKLSPFVFKPPKATFSSSFYGSEKEILYIWSEAFQLNIFGIYVHLTHVSDHGTSAHFYGDMILSNLDINSYDFILDLTHNTSTKKDVILHLHALIFLFSNPKEKEMLLH